MTARAAILIILEDEIEVHDIEKPGGSAGPEDFGALLIQSSAADKQSWQSAHSVKVETYPDLEAAEASCALKDWIYTWSKTVNEWMFKPPGCKWWVPLTETTRSDWANNDCEWSEFCKRWPTWMIRKSNELKESSRLEENTGIHSELTDLIQETKRELKQVDDRYHTAVKRFWDLTMEGTRILRQRNQADDEINAARQEQSALERRLHVLRTALSMLRPEETCQSEQNTKDESTRSTPTSNAELNGE